MQKQTFELDGRGITLYAATAPRLLFLQPVDEHDLALLGKEIEAMSACAVPFALAAFGIQDWNRDLSPWEAPPVFGNVPFGGGAAETLRFVTERLLPELQSRLSPVEDWTTCIGGYSLAGLFALWAATQTPLFSGVAAASPSVWFPGWLDYVREHPVRSEAVYLSLGDREERTRNPVMAAVGSCIREQYALLKETHTAALEWNPGNHFQDSELRTAKAFLCIAQQERNG